MTTTPPFPDDALFDEVIQAAVNANMHVISNGVRVVISPVIPRGWVKLAAKVIDRHLACLENPPCIA